MSEKQPGEAGEPTVPDDVWDRFARDSERDIRGSAPKEPSARARMVTERLRLEDEREAERAARRTARKKEPRQAAQPEGRQTGPAWREMDGRAARRRKVWAVLGVPLAVAVAVVAMKPSLLPGGLFDSADKAVPAGPRLPAETAAPTTPPSAAASRTPTRERPFAGSPAERWADGANAIVVPKATPVGSLTKEQVATALRGTKSLLVGADLDPATLRGERPAAAIAVLDPKQPRMIDDVDRMLRTPDKKHDPLTLFSRFDPREVSLVGHVVKTRGRITFKAGKDGSVAIHADYTFVYPVSPAGGGHARGDAHHRAPRPRRRVPRPGEVPGHAGQSDDRSLHPGDRQLRLRRPRRFPAPAVRLDRTRRRVADGPGRRPVRPQP
ncbi:hypothetical protein ABZV29_01380 [Streptomyces sp. NPDC005236]|uniref:hypothetical protein n=1 Tax=Streptomyces sp. NPDC005236 TaxID=3157028 RepID=UPI00339E150D